MVSQGFQLSITETVSWRFRVASSKQKVLSPRALADSCRRIDSRQTQRGDSETSPRDTVVVSGESSVYERVVSSCS